MRTVFALTLGLMVTGPLPAAPADRAGIEFFEKKVRPVLVEHCYKCHSQAAGKRKGGLYLDTRDGIRAGGDKGPAIVPGKPAEGFLLKAIRHTDDAFKMPPTNKLPDAAIGDLETWVKMGAPDPRDKAASVAAVAWDQVLRERRQWWSLQPVRKPPIPAVADSAWSEHPVDRFLLARLEAKGLAPAERADARTLIRRLSLVLTGLPPTPVEFERFVRECGPAGDMPDAAVERLVDRLLASPQFGERWARHWMDVVRFTETHGNEWNYEVHHAWRYRDYLIRAFNADVPFDQFIREHIAGDLLESPRRGSDGANESVIGTAFYRFGEVNHDDCIGLPQIGYDLADNQIDTLSKAFQATTVACARCHDHKLDAVSMKDYHAVLGILRSSRQVSHTIDPPAANAKAIQRLRELKAAIRKELAAVWKREASETSRYLPAAQARLSKLPDAGKLAQGLDPKRLGAWETTLKLDKMPLEDPLSPWRSFVASKAADTVEWKRIAERYANEDRERTAGEIQYTVWADFRSRMAAWQVGGLGLRDGPTRAGEVVVAVEGDAALRSILPSGCFTHSVSDRLNGTLRSPVVPMGKKHISFQVMGQRSSAVRLVSNNCQLNYKNYKALTTSDLQWVTFDPPDERDSLRTYAELMTMLDNPKFPDQLSALGGDTANYRVPWEKAVANPRSFFGVTRVVLHDRAEPPKASLCHLRPLFAGMPSKSTADLATRYAGVIEATVAAWADDRATDDDVQWLAYLLRHGLLGNSVTLTPRLQSLVKEYRQSEAGLAIPQVVPGMADFGPGIEQPVFDRGDCTKPGELVSRRYLGVLSGGDKPFPTAGSGRRELAERIASSSNPLTARVMVNRVWHYLFGAGLVRTVDDFGRVGEAPSHPELLDYLAVRFVEEGWSMKRLIRTLVLTRTFQLSNIPSAATREADPENRLLQHYPARRLEAEAIRDSILAASGRLDLTLYGLSVASWRDKEYADRRLFPGPLDGHGRRSVYIKNTLMEAPHFLSAFDFPGGKVTQGRRDVTNVPAQALALLNDPFVLQQADAWAERIVKRRDASVADRIEYLFQVALARPPRKDETARFQQAVAHFAELHGVPVGEVMSSRAVWKDLAHTMFNVKEFTYLP